MRYGPNTENGYKNIPGMTIGNRTPLVRAFPGCTIKFNKGYHYVFGFIGFPDGKWVYFSSSDDRGPVTYLVRTAKSDKDYKGGQNHHTRTNKKDELIEKIKYVATLEHRPFP